MRYESFLKVLLGLQKEQRTLGNLYENGVDLVNFSDSYQSIITELIKEIYGEDGYEWFSWYCYENEFGQKDWSTSPSYKMNEDGTSELINEAGEVRFGAQDAQGNPICYSHESLWEYLEKNHQAHNRCVQSTDMALVLFEITHNLKKKCDNICESMESDSDQFDGVYCVFQQIQELLEKYNISIDNLID